MGVGKILHDHLREMIEDLPFCGIFLEVQAVGGDASAVWNFFDESWSYRRLFSRSIIDLSLPFHGRYTPAGGLVIYEPAVEVRHHGSVVADRPEELARALSYYFAKHFPHRRSQRA